MTDPDECPNCGSSEITKVWENPDAVEDVGNTPPDLVGCDDCGVMEEPPCAE